MILFTLALNVVRDLINSVCIPMYVFLKTELSDEIFFPYFQARVQVPNPLSQQAPNPDSKVRPSLKNPKTQFFGLGGHNNHMGNPPPPPPLTFKHEGVLW